MSSASRAGHETIVAALEAQMAESPDSVAVAAGSAQLSYAALEDRTRRLAAALQARGVGPESIVGVMIERSIELVVALVATIRAGAAFLPLDPSLPEARLRAMVEDVEPALILAGPEHRSAATALAPSGDPAAMIAATEPDSFARAVPHPAGLAYVLFTSGTTGRPKAAGNTHAGLANRLGWMQSAYGLEARDRILQKTPTTFDVSVWEFFWPLLNGACIVMARPGGHRDLVYLKRSLRSAAITRLHFVPSMLEALLGEGIGRPLPWLRQVVASGEALAAKTAERFRAQCPGVPLDNLYGPTEAAIDVTAHRVDASADAQVIPIGRAIDGIAMHVVDRRLRPHADSSTGELCIAGIGLARGYLGRPDLTAASFVPDPHAPEPGGRMYRTGDLGLRRADGALLYQGRIDHQVKIGGQRVELLEVEAVLRGVPAMGACAVLLDAAGPAPILVAYAEVGAELAAAADREWLEDPEGEARAAPPASAVARLQARRDEGAPVSDGRAGKGGGRTLILAWRSDECGPPTTDVRRVTPAGLARLREGDADTILLPAIAHHFPSCHALEQVLDEARRALAPGGAVHLLDVIDPRGVAGFEALAPDDLAGLARLSTLEPGLLLTPSWLARWAAKHGGWATISREIPGGAGRFDAECRFGERPPAAPPAGAGEAPLATWPAWERCSRRLEAEAAPHLKSMLPAHMRPAAYIALPAMPITANGKADRKRLPPRAAFARGGAATALLPRERELAAIWGEVMGSAPGSGEDDFILAGGDSIQAIRLSARAFAHGWRLTLDDIHRARTLAGMALRLQPVEPSAGLPPPSFEPGCAAPAFVAGMIGESIAWPDSGVNVEQVHFTARSLDLALWRRAWEAAIRNHPLLHSRFHPDRHGLRIEPAPAEPLPMTCVDLSREGLPEAEARWQALVEAQAIEPFALSSEVPMRMCLANWPDGSRRGVWTLHHALTDGWSYKIVLDDVRSAYAALAAGRAPALPAASAFADWCRWRAANAPGAEDALFWRRYLCRVSALGPRAFPQGSRPPRLFRLEAEIGAEALARLQEAARCLDVNLYALVQAAWHEAIRTHWPAARIGALHAVRPPELAGIETVVGPLFTVLPVADDIGKAATMADLIRGLAADAAEKRNRLTADPVYLSGLDPEGGTFDAILVYENTPAIDDAGLIGDLRIRSRFNQPLVALVWPEARTMRIDLHVDAVRVEPSAGPALLERFRNGLESTADRLDRPPAARDGSGAAAEEELVDLAF